MLIIQWLDLKREPQCPPDPKHPLGVDFDISEGAERVCSVPLPYPAKRCGVYVVTCDVCRLRIAITTAGRPDDPRSLKVACRQLNE